MSQMSQKPGRTLIFAPIWWWTVLMRLKNYDIQGGGSLAASINVPLHMTVGQEAGVRQFDLQALNRGRDDEDGTMYHALISAD